MWDTTFCFIFLRDPTFAIIFLRILCEYALDFRPLELIILNKSMWLQQPGCIVWQSDNVSGLTELAPALPPPPMFCSLCDGDPGKGSDNCCQSDPAVNNRKPKKPKKKGFPPKDNCFSTLPHVRSQSFSTKNSSRDDCKAGIQVWEPGIGIKTKYVPT